MNPSRRRRRPSGRMAIPALALMMASAAAACGSLGEPYLGSFPSTSQAVISNDVGNAEPGSTSDPGAAGPADALPPRPEGYAPSIVVATVDGEFGVIERRFLNGALRPRTVQPLFADEDVEADDDPPGSVSTTTTEADVVLEAQPRRAVVALADDLFGGLVVQTEDGVVSWWAANADTARQVDSGEGRLVDVGFGDGTPEAITERLGVVSRTRLIDDETLPLTTLEAGEELVDLSSSGRVVVIATRDSACGSVEFVSSDGTPLAIAPLADVPCDEAGRPSIGAVAMSLDGEAVAYTVVRYRADGVEESTRLRAVELTSGAPIIDIEVGASGQSISSLSFDGLSAVMVRRSSAESEAILADARSVSVLDLGDLGSPRLVSFARLPLAVG